MLAANLAAAFDAWLRLLTLHDTEDLTDAEPDTMRFRLYHPPARQARRRYLGTGVRHQVDEARPAAGHHLTARTRPDEDQEGGLPRSPRACGTRRSCSVTRRPALQQQRILRANRSTDQRPKPTEESRLTNYR
ncbi:hypothetical protein GCM10011578_094310 [Streptomyces fuscichromogenes]|uniref:Uncharacterized protein n=1 Tax=Streptomyces fuscichromogenes TaxID=1324013 RepID=A0A918CX92_9ACTN|nr:hypothetical protein GCM10011578_094310 [Streptomyces fuscichromogenes]